MSTNDDALTDHFTPLRSKAIGDRFDAQELADEAGEGRHRPAAGAACDRGDRHTLLRRRALVDDEADRPVAVAHRAWRQPEDDEPETVERDRTEGAALDLECHRERARPLCRLDRHLAGHARTDEVAAARFVILAAHVPRCGHSVVLCVHGSANAMYSPE